MRNKFGWVTFSEHAQENVIIPKEPPLEFKNQKSLSERLRNVIFIEWQQKKSEEAFEDYRRRRMEEFIDQVKEKLE